jgi:hypothetical protein
MFARIGNTMCRRSVIVPASWMQGLSNGTAAVCLTKYAALLPPHLCDVGVAHDEVTQTCTGSSSHSSSSSSSEARSRDVFRYAATALPAAMDTADGLGLRLCCWIG